MSEDPLPTPDEQAQIVQYVQAGAFPHVAAEAVGVRPEVFEQWLHWALEPEGKPECRRLAAAVGRAAALARVSAEARVLKERPLDWLRYGPGKQAERPGWTGPVPGGPADAGEPAEELTYQMIAALLPFPEARVAVARVLDGES